MALQRLLDTAFTRGCSITVEYAQRTPRYAELVEDSSTTTVDNPEEFALVRYLGERLADRAAQNLPAKIKHSLHLWNDGLEAQQQFLNLVINELSSENWMKRRSGKRNHSYSSRNTVLPSMTKSWARGLLQPNCLGMAQTLVGMARFLGARHYVINVLHGNDERKLAEELEVFTWLYEQLEQFNNLIEVRRIRKMLFANREKALLHLAKVQEVQAHHALVIELQDGTWMIVDPYFSVLHQFNRFHTKIVQKKLENIAKGPTRTVMFSGELMPAKLVRAAGKQERVLETGILYALQRMSKDEPGDINAVAWVVSAAYAGFPKGADEGQTNAQNRDFTYLYNLLWIYTCIPEWRRESFIDDLSKPIQRTKSLEELQDEFAVYRAAVKRDKVRRQRAYPRMARALTRTLMDELRNGQSGKRHYAIEVADPAVMLGTATLNHLRVRTGTYVHGRLSVYTSSQWVLLDTLSAQYRGDMPDAESERAITAQQARMHKTDPRLVLTALHNLEREYRHG